MLGKPKYKIGDIVNFKVVDNQEIIKKGIVAIVDEYGTFFNNSDVSYDILNKEENMLYKHFSESCVLEKVGEISPNNVWD
jgi:hypothetical protein